MQMQILTGAFLFLQISYFSLAIKSMSWAGYEWFIRDSKNQGPGPNNWTSTNVWVDNRNRLHLKVTYSPSSGWSCAKLQTDVKFGFGTYRWFVEGAIDKFDPNIVLGLFTYGGVDYINEIDIEIAKWGRNQTSNLFYTVYPSNSGNKSISTETQMILKGTYTTHLFTWTKDCVHFQSQHGFKSSPNQNIFFSYQTPSTFSESMAVLHVPLHMNLWMFKGRPPTDGKDVEIVVHDFQYVESMDG